MSPILWPGRFLIAVALLLACAADAPRAAFPHLSVAWTTPLNVVSGPRMAGGGWIGDPALVYATHNGRLYLIAIDSATGKERWRQPATPGGAPRGVSLTPRVFSGFPVYFRQGNKGVYSAQLVVADPFTGEDLVVTKTAFFVSMPEICENSARSICIMAVTDTKSTAATWRELAIDGVSDALEAYPAVSAMPSGWPLGPRNMLLFSDSGGSEHIGVYQYSRSNPWEGEELWRRPVRSVFGEEYGNGQWEWSYNSKSDLYVGSLRSRPQKRDAEMLITDLAHNTKLAAIRRSTGRFSGAKKVSTTYVTTSSGRRPPSL